MGKHGDNSGTAWPTGIDTACTEIDFTTKARAAVPNDISQAVVALENYAANQFVDTQRFTTFAAAEAAAYLAGKCLLLTTQLTISAAQTVRVPIMPLPGGVLIKSGAGALTFLGAVIGNPMHQWLSGFSAGDILFAGNVYSIFVPVIPLWTGFAEGSGKGAANSTAWSVMMNALPSAHVRPVIEIPYGRYEIAGDPAILIDRSCTIYWNKAIFIQTDYSQNHAAVMINRGTTGVSLSEVTIHEPTITNGLGGFVDYARLDTRGATAEGSGLVVKGCSGLIIHHPFIDGFRQNVYFTDQVGGDSTSLIEIYAPQLRNGLINFYVRASSHAVTSINVFSGVIQNNAACTGANTRLVLLDGRDGNGGSDGIIFHGTTIQNGYFNGMAKIEIKKMDECAFNNVYYDLPSSSTDIIIDSDVFGTIFNGGAGFDIQRILDNGIDTKYTSPESGVYTRNISADGSFFTLGAQQSAYEVVRLIGVLALSMAIYVPKNKTQYTIHNDTTGSYSLYVYVIGGAGVGVEIPQHGCTVIYCDGTDIIEVSSQVPKFLYLVDGVGVTAPPAGLAKIIVDTADGDLKVVFGNGIGKTLSVDTQISDNADTAMTFTGADTVSKAEVVLLQTEINEIKAILRTTGIYG